MLLSNRVSHQIRFAFPSSEELASLDNASAWRFSDRGMCIIKKCFSRPVASHTRRI